MAAVDKAKVYAGVRRLLEPLTGSLVDNRVTPNHLTAAGLALNAVVAFLIVTGHFLPAAVVFLVAGVCDMLDGAVARLGQRVTPFGAFLDSTSDRIAEGLVLGAIALWFADRGRIVEVAAVVVALVASFLVSYTRARAEALGLDCQVGLMARPERIVLLTAGLALAPHWSSLSVAVFVLAVLTSFTVVQRILHVRRQLAAGAR